MPTYPTLAHSLMRLMRAMDRASTCYQMTYVPGNRLGPKGDGGMTRSLREARGIRGRWYRLLKNSVGASSHVLVIVAVLDLVVNEFETALLFLNLHLTMTLTHGSIIGTHGICHILQSLLDIEDAIETSDELAFPMCREILRLAARNAVAIKAHRSAYDLIRTDPACQTYVKQETEAIQSHEGDVSFGGLRARCLGKYPTTETARWVAVETIVTSGLPVKGDVCSTSYIMSIRSVRSIDTVESSSSIVFDEQMNREDNISLTPWWTPSEDGALYLADSSKSWFISWDDQIAEHNDFKNVYAPVSHKQVQKNGCGSWLRYRCTELRHVPFEVDWEGVFQMGDAFHKLGPKLTAQHKQINESYKEARKPLNPVSCDAAREMLLCLYSEWPIFANEFVKRNMSIVPAVDMARATSDGSAWARQLLRRAIAGVNGGSMKVNLSNGKCIILPGNREDSSSTELKHAPTTGGAFVSSPREGTRKVESVADIAQACAGMSQDQITGLITGIQMLNVRLSAGSLLPRNDDWLNPMSWPQANGTMLGKDGPSTKDTDCSRDPYKTATRKNFISPMLPFEMAEVAGGPGSSLGASPS